jgi:epimerase transport system membrane fusion protein
MVDLTGLSLVPGMPAEVLINTGERTLFQYLTQPISNAFARSLIEE